MPLTDTSACPSCTTCMTRLQLQGKSGGALALDLCHPCQGIWFDAFESEQLMPGSVITLFQDIHAHRDDIRQPLPATLRCPRCNDRLQPCRDMTRSGRFSYHRCPAGHGRFTLFGQFMIEKGFVRQLAPTEIQAVAARIGTIRCSGCGASIDIRAEDACPHCGAAISILDPEAVAKALSGYQEAAARLHEIDPVRVADALLALEKRNPPPHGAEVAMGDLILSSIGMALNLLDH